MTPKKTILVLASTYPRYIKDPEPSFIHELNKRLCKEFNIIAIVPDAPHAMQDGLFEDVEVIRYRYAPKKLQTLVHNGGIVNNLRAAAWKWFLVPSFIFGQYLAVKKILKQRKVDAIHAHWLIPQGWIAALLSQHFNIPFILTSHGGDLFGLQGKLLTNIKRKVAEKAATMTVVSQAMQEYLDQVNIKPKTLKVIPMGVDLKGRFIPGPNIQRHDNELLFVGRLVPKKGLNYLLDILPVLLQKYPKLRLNIVGFGPEEDVLKAQVEQLNLQQHVNFLGALSQEELPALYQRTTLFVAPFVRAKNGDQEGLPVALMEAIGCGCPAVVGYVAGIEDLLGKDITHIAVNPQQPQELIDAISTALDAPKLAHECAMRIRQNAVNLIDWESVATAYAKVLTDSIEHFAKGN